ncbi:anaphase-promoting complex subunit 11 RING-H2 finger-domain-containing protein [Aspergillus spectabilis]
MKVTLKEWNAVATWRWDMPEDEVCGICRVQFDGTCPTCKFPGDDCSLLLGKCGHSFHMPDSSAMSLPKLASSPLLSSSPSKQSFRRPTSRPQSINQIAQTNDIPDEHLSPHLAAENISHLAEQDEQAQHESPSLSRILSQPFFTLIEDTHTSEYYHPTVHYIFSDDDTDIVTEAALRSLDSEAEAFPALSTKGKSKAHLTTQDTEAEEPHEDEDEPPPRKDSLLPDPTPGVRDNYIILDIDNTPPTIHTLGEEPGTQPEPQPQPENPSPTPNPIANPPHNLTVTSAHSLSPTWQVLNTSLLPAPTFENSSESQNGGLMLQIRGTSGFPTGNLLGKDKERDGQRLEEMMEQFGRRLDELRLVIENGERGLALGPGVRVFDETTQVVCT